MLENNIVTERLSIRNITKEDANDVWLIWSNSNNEKYVSNSFKSLYELVDVCEQNGPWNLTVATLKDTDEIIGTCSFGNTDPKEWGLGYSIKEKHWGKGYATEIVKSVIELGHSIGIVEFWASCAIENVASAKVLEKCGMRIVHKGEFKNPKSNIVYESHTYALHLD